MASAVLENIGQLGGVVEIEGWRPLQGRREPAVGVSDRGRRKQSKSLKTLLASQGANVA